MVRRRVGVLERNTVKSLGEIAIREAVEVEFGLTEAGPVGVDAAGAWRHLNSLRVIPDR
jgi:hypothetical protein